MVDMLAAVYWYDEALQAGLRANGWASLSRTHSMIFTNMSAGVCRPTQLARNIGISRQAISHALAEMEAAGLVTLGPDPDDRRAQRAAFSPQSAAIRRDAVKIFDTIDAVLASRVGARDVQHLKEIFSRDWGASPAEIVATAFGSPPPAPKRRGRPPRSPRAKPQPIEPSRS
ncbi:MarR family winged helix-turn-helix transcriptional regulator [Sandaracinobacteroides hominis]|uniref:MarR family winged helix-turn-helix transcriptional regulator n=1 Tax=Sandaracinobacteroides hominis TaxID=2780086 RepID=UPI0018F33CA1|nr:MarR family transcriptional regulator [Sandaracinobacteroides hominis]